MHKINLVLYFENNHNNESVLYVVFFFVQFCQFVQVYSIFFFRSFAHADAVLLYPIFDFILFICDVLYFL